jgi:hypothetical protein
MEIKEINSSGTEKQMDKYEIIGHSEQLDNILRIFFLLKLNV